MSRPDQSVRLGFAKTVVRIRQTCSGCSFAAGSVQCRLRYSDGRVDSAALGQLLLSSPDSCTLACSFLPSAPDDRSVILWSLDSGGYFFRGPPFAIERSVVEPPPWGFALQLAAYALVTAVPFSIWARCGPERRRRLPRWLRVYCFLVHQRVRSKQLPAEPRPFSFHLLAMFLWPPFCAVAFLGRAWVLGMSLGLAIVGSACGAGDSLVEAVVAMSLSLTVSAESAWQLSHCASGADPASVQAAALAALCGCFAVAFSLARIARRSDWRWFVCSTCDAIAEGGGPWPGKDCCRAQLKKERRRRVRERLVRAVRVQDCAGEVMDFLSVEEPPLECLPP